MGMSEWGDLPGLPSEWVKSILSGEITLTEWQAKITDNIVRKARNDDWYDSLGLALRIIGKRWYDDLTEDEDAFVFAFADEVSERPEPERDEDAVENLRHPR